MKNVEVKKNIELQAINKFRELLGLLQYGKEHWVYS